MKKLNLKTIQAHADSIYRRELAPTETERNIRSRQVRAAIRAIVHAINKANGN